MSIRIKDGTTRCNMPHPDFPEVICRINRGDHREQTHRVETPLGIVEWPMSDDEAHEAPAGPPISMWAPAPWESCY